MGPRRPRRAHGREHARQGRGRRVRQSIDVLPLGVGVPPGTQDRLVLPRGEFADVAPSGHGPAGGAVDLVGVHVGALPREDARLWLFWGHHSQFSLMPLVHITFI